MFSKPCALVLILFFTSVKCGTLVELIEHDPEPTAASSSTECPPGSGVGESGSCEPCAPGSMSSHQDCSPCYAGTFQSEAGQTSCTPCPKGSFSLEGATSCTLCPEGEVLLGNGICGACPAGEYYTEYDYSYSPQCTQCDSGFFKAEAGFDPCLPCEGTSYSAPGSVSCTTCPEHQALFRNGSCGSCPPGQYYESYSLSCTDCYPGSFTNCYNTRSNCYPCGGNSFSLMGAAECIECPRGTVYIASSKSCETCPPGTAYDSYVAECSECGYNEFSRGRDGGYCESCAKNSFARRGATTCFTCPRGLVFIADIDGCGSCEEGESYTAYTASCGDYYYYGTEEPQPTAELVE